MEDRGMDRSAKFLSVIYNWLGIVGLTALVYGVRSMMGGYGTGFRVFGMNHLIILVLTIAFFVTSYFLLSKNKWGLFIPIFGLTFLMTGGYVILLPLLMLHLLFINMPSVQKQFV